MGMARIICGYISHMAFWAFKNLCLILHVFWHQLNIISVICDPWEKIPNISGYKRVFGTLVPSKWPPTRSLYDAEKTFFVVHTSGTYFHLWNSVNLAHFDLYTTFGTSPMCLWSAWSKYFLWDNLIDLQTHSYSKRAGVHPTGTFEGRQKWWIRPILPKFTNSWMFRGA